MWKAPRGEAEEPRAHTKGPEGQGVSGCRLTGDK